MEIRVDNVSQLSLNRQGKLLHNHLRVDRPWTKTLYRIEGNQLICRHFNIVGLFLHFLGYKKEFNSENLTSYLKNNIKTLNGKDSVTQAVAFEALGKVCEVKRNFFEHNYESEKEAIALFKEQGLDVNAYERDMGKTALMSACHRGEFDLAKYLMEQGANINHKEKDEGLVALTALHCSLQSKNPNVIELLIDNGAELNVQDACGHSGFFLLVSAYLNTDPKDENKTKLLNLVHKALAKNPDFTQVGNEGDVLEMACKRGNLEMVQLLVKHNASLFVYGKLRANFYVVGAIQSGNVELLRWILDQGVSLDYPREMSVVKGRGVPSHTPLTEAISHTPQGKVLEMVRLILERGQDPNEPYNGGIGFNYFRTPLQVATLSGNLDVVKLLVANGATDFKGALEDAKRLGQIAIVEYLESVMTKA